MISSFKDILAGMEPYSVVLSSISMLAVVVSFINFRRQRRIHKIAYNIAVIGFPRSGKTTLITALFNEIMINNVLNIDSAVKGHDTIEKINSDLEKLKLGQTLGATQDQDVFAYRFDMTKRKIFGFQDYKVQIGDFPGEDSESFYENFGQWLHKTPFFKWVMQADSFVFVIDLAKVLVEGRTYELEMTKSIIAAWQHINDYHSETTNFIKHAPVSVVFTKSDLLYEPYRGLTKETILAIGFENLRTRARVVDHNLEETSKISEKFEDLENFFKNQNVKFEFIFASYWVKIRSQKSALGMKEILTHSLGKLNSSRTS